MIRRFGCTIFSVLLLLAVEPVLGTAEKALTQADANSQVEQAHFGQDNPNDTIFKYEKKTQDTLLQVKGSGESRSYADEDNGVFGLETLFGQLLFRDNGGFDGYYFLSGKFESDNRFRFNSTFGYFPGSLGGETRLTYRFLNADVFDTLSLDDDVEGFLDDQYSEKATEQGLGFSYKRRLQIVIKELTFDYSYTHLGSERLTTAPFDIDTQAAFRRVQADIGFGDIDTHEALVGAAFGADNIDSPIVRGLRLDLQSGYQQADYGGFDSFAGVTDRGFSGGAELQTCTPYGLFKGGYQDSQAAETSYGNYQLGGLDIYYRHINYPYSEDEEVIGIGITIDPYDPGDVFNRACPRLFYLQNDRYDSVAQMAHIGRLASDDFTAKPQVRLVYKDLLRVDKANLPTNVSIDSNEPGNPRLVVRTGCNQRGLRYAKPQSASSAFATGGQNIYVSVAGLPEGQQSVVATFNDECCGDTQVRLSTAAADTPSITSVRVQESVGCIEEVTGGGAPVCLPLNAVCDVNNNNCCAGLTCESVSGLPAGICVP